jgi:hypothetical protein
MAGNHAFESTRVENGEAAATDVDGSRCAPQGEKLAHELARHAEHEGEVLL